MTGNKSITVYRIRRGRRKHRTKQKAPKQSDDYHDGHIKHADRTAKFITRTFYSEADILNCREDFDVIVCCGEQILLPLAGIRIENIEAVK